MQKSLSKIPVKNATNAWSVADFELYRPHLTSFIADKCLGLLDDDQCRRAAIRAPVKSGKREMAEYLAQRDACHNPRRMHVFISAFHRTSDGDQRDELSIHNLGVFSVTTGKKAEECINWIKTVISSGKAVLLHIDECDFGSGERQILGRVYKTYRLNESVTFFLYSATPQEVMFSGEIDVQKGEENGYGELVDEIINTGNFIEYHPPEGYCGPARFLDEGLVKDATPFFEKLPDGSIRLTKQGLEIMKDLKQMISVDPKRNILILRLSSCELNSTKRGKDNKMIYQFLNGIGRCEDLQDITIIMHKDERELAKFKGDVLFETIQWSNPKYWKSKITGEPIIFVIDQTASRSTELACHDRIFALHDYRNTVVFTTVSQAQERVNHYEERYGGFQPIRIYGHKKTFELSSGRIDYNTYMTNKWKKGSKVQHQDAYKIVSTRDNKVNHPKYNKYYSSHKADLILQHLSSFVCVKVSPRVKGRTGYRPIFGCQFIPCQPDEYESKKSQIISFVPFKHNFLNPFSESIKRGKEDGKFKGHLRGWKVWDFSDINEKGWGTKGSARLTICYKEDVLGIAVRWDTGRVEPINTLETYKSMFKH